ncbi:MAG TPA: hypothetical protein DDW34_06790 [Clostridium sp.]|nr:hypothetical protein [Clostridium sp.]
MTQDELSQKLVEVEQRSRSNTRRLDSMEKRQDNLEQLTQAVAVMQKEQEYMKDDISEIKSDVKILTNVPAERWKDAVNAAIKIIVGAVIGYLLSGGRLP